jgi:GDP-mannose transporter
MQVGIVCKILTVMINFMIWDKHASPEGVACLLVCVLAGSLYEQAPMRSAPAAAPNAAEAGAVEEKVPLLAQDSSRWKEGKQGETVAAQLPAR